MKQVILSKPFGSEEEYFAFEEKSELKHEYIDSTLFEMSGTSRFHNTVVINLIILLKQLLLGKNMDLFVDGYKVRTPEGNFFYPDVIISQPSSHRYYTENPILIIEVLSDSTRAFDLADKFIQYRKCPTLEYYLCIEPEHTAVNFYYLNKENEWQAYIYNHKKDVINLPKLGISIPLKDIYVA